MGAKVVHERQAEGPTRRLTCVIGADDGELNVGTPLRLGERTVGRLVNTGRLPLGDGWIGLALVEAPLAHPGIGQMVAATDSGEVPLRTVSPPVIRNRSLFIDPQQHSARTRQNDRFPPLFGRTSNGSL